MIFRKIQILVCFTAYCTLVQSQIRNFSLHFDSLQYTSTSHYATFHIDSLDSQKGLTSDINDKDLDFGDVEEFNFQGFGVAMYDLDKKKTEFKIISFGYDSVGVESFARFEKYSEEDGRRLFTLKTRKQPDVIGFDHLMGKYCSFRGYNLASRTQLGIIQSNIDNLNIEADEYLYLNLNNDSIRQMTIECDSLNLEIEGNVYLSKIYFKNLLLEINKSGLYLPDTIFFSDFRSKEFLDLNKWKFDINKTHAIGFNNIDFKNFNFNYKYFQLIPISDLDTVFESDMTAYRLAIREMQKQNGYTEGFEKIDKEIRAEDHLSKHHFFINWLDKNWWDYGIPSANPVLSLQ